MPRNAPRTHATFEYLETPDVRREQDAEARARALKCWIVLCETASLDFFARRGDLHNANAYQLRAEPCPRHGTVCLHLLCGMMMQHVRWESIDPVQAALELLTIFLPDSRASALERARDQSRGSTTERPAPALNGGSSSGLASRARVQSISFQGRAQPRQTTS